jgi:hypothetical protein
MTPNKTLHSFGQVSRFYSHYLDDFDDFTSLTKLPNFKAATLARIENIIYLYPFLQVLPPHIAWYKYFKHLKLM